MKSFKKIFQDIQKKMWEVRNGSKPKIFGIGNNKTGTTSLKVAMGDLGFKVGEQRPAERMLHYWAKRDFKPIVEYCKTERIFHGRIKRQ